MIQILESKADTQKLIDFVGQKYADLFLKLKNRMKSPENDIYYWLKKDPDDLKAFINNLNYTQSKSQEKKQAKAEGAELIKETDDWLVYKINTYNASKYYGKNTKWCISGNYPNEENRGQYWFNDYTEKGVKFYFYINKHNDYDKYAIAIYKDGNSEKYNAEDNMINVLPDSVPEIKNIYKKPEEFEIQNGILIKYNGSGGNVIIPDNVTSIGDYAFDECKSLISVIIPDSVTIIDFGAFNYCIGLTNAIIPNSVKSIGRYAFHGCTGLTSVTIGNNVTSIGDNAFDYCTGLTSITISDSVTIIGWYAFDRCEKLKDIYYKGTKKQWDEIDIKAHNEYLLNAMIHCKDGIIVKEDINNNSIDYYKEKLKDVNITLEERHEYMDKIHELRQSENNKNLDEAIITKDNSKIEDMINSLQADIDYFQSKLKDPNLSRDMKQQYIGYILDLKNEINKQKKELSQNNNNKIEEKEYSIEMLEEINKDFKIDTSIKDELNPVLWEDNKLKPEIREKILKVVEEFENSLKDDEIDLNIIDIELVGSNASYNYTKNSDVDVHIIVNFDDYGEPDKIVKAMFDANKANFNNKYDINFKDFNVELYVEDINSAPVSNGIYSVKKDTWIKVPEKIESVEVNLEPELSNELDKVEACLDSESIEEVQDYINDLYIKRRNSLATDGEFGKYNLIFKMIRNNGYLDELKNKLAELKSKELSLENLNNDKTEEESSEEINVSKELLKGEND